VIDAVVQVALCNGAAIGAPEQGRRPRSRQVAYSETREKKTRLVMTTLS
jgi:hypothetical protein